MTQYVINIGTLPNDGTGDPLRTAFNEVNLNFDQVFAAGPVLSNVRIANNTILTTNTNGNLILAPNGIGVVQANVNLVPNTANIRNLGSADRRWSTLYIQYANISGSISVADLTATGNVTVGGNLSVTGNIINVANIITDAKTIQLANTAGTANAANGSGITVGANDAIATFLFNSANAAWATNIGMQVGGPVTGTSIAVSDATVYGNLNTINGNFTGTVTTPNIVVNNISSDDSTFVTIQDGLDVNGDIETQNITVNGTAITGNILPAANVTYSLGNSSLWWSNVWVAGNTIYIGGVPIGMSAGNVLTVNGNAVLQNDSNTSISTTGNITADYFFGDGSQLTNLPVNTGNVTFDNQIIQGTGDEYGGGGLYLAPGPNSSANLQYLRVRGGDYPTHIHVDTGNNNYFDQYFGADFRYVKLEANGNIVINADDDNGNSATWTFDYNGNLTAPGNISATGNIQAGNISASGNVIATGNANVLTLTTRNGDSNNSYASPQIIMGYAGTADYPSFIHTTHNASTPVDNTIEFWTSDGTQAGTFPANAVLGLTVTNGNIETGNISANSRVITTPIALANLTAVAGGRAFVNDANLVAANNFGAQISGGGSNTVPVWSDGTNWYIG